MGSQRNEHRAPRHDRRAFTAVEMLVALTLGALVLAGVGGIMMGLYRDHAAAVAVLKAEGWKLRLAELLEADFINSRSFRAQTHQLVFEGYGTVGDSRGQIVHQPARITYRFVRIQDESYLVRDETHLGSAGGPVIRRELMARGANRFQFHRRSDTDVTPGHYRLALVNLDAADRPLLVTTLVRHGVHP